MLSLDRVSVIYASGTTALHPTSLAFVPGQFTALIGAAGAGKSTPLRCLNGLVRPIRGDVFRGRAVNLCIETYSAAPPEACRGARRGRCHDFLRF